MKIWSGKAAQDHGVLREFGSSAYFSAKNGKVNPQAKRFVFLGVKRNGYRLWDPENKKIVVGRHVTFGETSVEVHRLSAGGEDGDQGKIAAGGG